MKPMIRDAYVSVEIADRGLEGLSSGLAALFADAGIECERASSAAHVSIAYGEGDVEFEALERVASEIAALPFSVHVAGFEILKGETTAFDYLVVVLEGLSFGTAQLVASGCMKTRSFEGGFRSHVSLLKFPKSKCDHSHAWAQRVMAEMNGCQALVRFFCQRSLRGSSVAIFGSDRQCWMTKSIAA